MKRRAVLAATGSALLASAAGCLAEGSGPSDGIGDDTSRYGNDDTPDDNGNETGEHGTETGPSEGFGRHVAVTSVDDVPEGLPVSFDIRVSGETITTAGSGRLEVSVTNTGETAREVATPFYKGTSEDEPGILLYSLEAPDSPDAGGEPSCITDPSPSQESVEWTDEGPLHHRLDPGMTGTDELVLASDPTVEGCFPPGEYRFETGHSVDGTEFTWGFTVEITRASSTERSDSDPERRYEECPREVIPYEQFPTDVQAELDAALDGQYEADRVYLREAMDTDQSYLSVTGAFYEATVSVDEGIEILDLALVEPKALPNARPVSVTHHFDGRRTVTVELVAADGTVLVDQTQETLPEGEFEFGRTHRVGSHELRVTVADGDDVITEWMRTVPIDQSRFSVVVDITADEVTLTGAVAELGYCRYDGSA
jgi:hypothetical protein